VGRSKRGRARAAAHPHPPASQPTRTGVVLVVLAILVGWAWAPSFSGVLLFDDIPAISNNETTKPPLSLRRMLNPPEGTTVSGRPVANLSFALNNLADDDAAERLAGYHALNLGIHVLAACALFGVARRTLASPPTPEGLRVAASPVALALSTIWAVHPLTTSAVTYVVQRVESLMALFYLTTVYCAIRFLESQRRSTLWACGAITCCALGMATKEVMVTAPMAVLLWAHLFGSPEPHHSRRSRIAFNAGLWLTLAIPLTLAVVQRSEALAVLRLAVRSDAETGSAAGFLWTPWSYLLTQSAVIVHYLRLAIVPQPLVFDYYGWPQAHGLLSVGLQAAGLTLVLMLAVIGVVRRRAAGFVGSWFFLTLAPSSSVFPIPTEIAAEHRMYLPLAAVIAGGVILAHLLLRRWGRGLQLALLAIVVVVFAATTRDRNEDYASVQRMWQDVVEKRPSNARARINYGITLMADERFADAAEQMRIAVTLPADAKTAAQAHLQLGSALSAQGRFAEGEESLRQALALDDSVWEAHMVLGQAYSERGDASRAVHHLRRAVEHNPSQVLLLNRIVWLLATLPQPELRDGATAVLLGERALALSQGRNPQTLGALAAAYAASGRFAEAVTMAERAQSVSLAAGDVASAATTALHLAAYRGGSALYVPLLPR